jgi:hypothetical protein
MNTGSNIIRLKPTVKNKNCCTLILWEKNKSRPKKTDNTKFKLLLSCRNKYRFIITALKRNEPKIRELSVEPWDIRTGEQIYKSDVKTAMARLNVK